MVIPYAHLSLLSTIIFSTELTRAEFVEWQRYMAPKQLLLKSLSCCQILFISFALSEALIRDGYQLLFEIISSLGTTLSRSSFSWTAYFGSASFAISCFLSWTFSSSFTVLLRWMYSITWLWNKPIQWDPDLYICLLPWLCIQTSHIPQT